VKKLLLMLLVVFVTVLVTLGIKALPTRVIYDAEIVDKSTMVVDARSTQYCLEIKYSPGANMTITKWICSKWGSDIGYFSTDVGDKIRYKTWRY